MFNLLKRIQSYFNGNLKNHENEVDRLYWRIFNYSRSPEYYQDFGVGDNIEGRYEMLMLHLWLAMRHIDSETSDGKVYRQDLFDTTFDYLDSNLREMGVSDIKIGKKIRGMTVSFIGRMEAYESALREGRGQFANVLKKNTEASENTIGAFVEYIFDLDEKNTKKVSDINEIREVIPKLFQF